MPKLLAKYVYIDNTARFLEELHVGADGVNQSQVNTPCPRFARCSKEANSASYQN
jgi:hypothetical protein